MVMCVRLYLIFNNKKWLLNKGYFPVRKRCYLPNFSVVENYEEMRRYPTWDDRIQIKNDLFIS